jgi:hypothetical protein
MNTEDTHEEGNFTGDRYTTPIAVFQEDLDQEVDVIVQDKLAKASITDYVIDSLREEAAPLAAIERIESDEQYKLVQGMLTKLIRTRNVAVRICENGRKPLNMLRNAWIAKEKEVVGRVEEIEAPLARLKDAYKAEQERKAQEEEASKQAARVARYTQIEQLGFTRRYRVDGTQVYFLGETEFEVEAIDAADTETFPNMLRSARMVQEEIQAARAQQELEAQQERERIAQEQEALRQQQAEMARREAEMREREEAIARAEQAAKWAEELRIEKERLAAETTVNESLTVQMEVIPQEEVKQQAIAQAVAEIEAESGEIVEVNRERVLRILFSVQEVLPYAQAEGNDKWNAGLEELSNDVMELRRDLGDETLGPDADKLNEPW